MEYNQAKIESINVSENWKQKFKLIEKAGGVRLRNLKELSLKERIKVGFNLWGYLAGPFYYITKGMWKKAITYSLGWILLLTLAEIFGWGSYIPELALMAIFGSMSNKDYYSYRVLGENQWF